MTGPLGLAAPLGPGAFVAVVGASGAGKDALLSHARPRVPAGVLFPRRVITRPPGPGEDHDPVTVPEFAALLAMGDFAAHWDAHGLRYGIPVAADAAVADGRVVVANVSRAALGSLGARYQRLAVVLVTVSPEVRAARLRDRGREPEADALLRLARPDPAPGHRADVVIDNSGPLEAGGEQLVRTIHAAAP
jgi:ribose 1,5-bisphosphokinase